ncbi:hypothetical protein GQ457_04G018560 [Hibiscus cannabinus]
MANNTISLRSLLEKEKLNDINFLDSIGCGSKNPTYVIEEPVPNDPGANAHRADKDKFKKYMDDMVDVGCLMLVTMTPELQKQHEDMVAYEMIQNLKEIYEGKAREERYETSKALFQCKMSQGSPVGAHVIKMMGYIQTWEKLGFPLNDELAIDVVLQSLPDSFNQFVLNFNTNCRNLDIGRETAMFILKWSRRLKQLEHQSQGLHMRRNLAKGDVDLRVGNGVRLAALARETHIEKLHKDGLLDPFVFEQIDVCESCLLEKMTKAPFSGKDERASDLLGLIHSDVCGPMNTQARGGFQYFITFTDDFSRYEYIYLMRHKFEALEKFKEFKNEVQNQHGKSIKALRSDRGGEYLSQDFDELLKEWEIVSQLTPPGMPQWNGLSERRNRTLLDMFDP